MLTENNAEDEPVLPEDVLANEEEIREAVARARVNPALQTRLMKAAQYFLRATKRLKRTCEPEDLLHDALVAVMAGNRRWCKNRVDFKGLLVGVMRSLASSQDKALMKPDVLDITPEHSLPPVGEAQEPRRLEDLAVDPQSSEGTLVFYENEAFVESQLAILQDRYGADTPHGRILALVRDGLETHLDIRKALGIDESKYRNYWKALMRAADNINSNAKE